MQSRVYKSFKHYKTAALCAVCIVLSAFSTPLTQDSEATRKQLEKLEAEIAKRKASKQALENKAQSAEKEISTLQQQMVDVGQKIQRTEGTVFRLDNRIADLQEMTRTKRRDLLAKNENMVELMAALQRMGRRPTTAAILKPGEALDTARSAALLSTLLPLIDERAVMLKRDLTYLAELYAELSDKRFTLKNSLGLLAQEQTVLKNLVARRELEENDARAAARGESLRIARLVRSSKSTKDLLKKLDQESLRMRLEQAKRELARVKQASSSSGSTPSVRIKPKAPARKAASESKAAPVALMPAPAGAKFSSLRGKMPYPSYGKIVKKFGQPDGIGTTAKGIRMRVRAGSQVVSPFEGRVVYAGPFRDYGQLVIIAHKDGYHGLLAGMGSLYTAMNQWVLQGEPLGLIGGTNTGAVVRSSQLYFELRNKSGPINPLPWLSKPVE